MAQQGEDEVDPVSGLYRPEEHPSADDLLSDLSHEDRVFEIVIEGITGADALDQESAAGIKNCRAVRFPVTEVVTVCGGQLPAKCLRCQYGNIQHRLPILVRGTDD